MTLIVPISPVPRQSFSVTLGGQSCHINLYQTDHGVFMDLYVGTALIIGGVLCRNNCRIAQFAYLGFVGDLAFQDVNAPPGAGADPVYQGFGSQFVMVYYSPVDLAA